MKLDASDEVTRSGSKFSASDGLSKFKSFVALRVAFCALMIVFSIRK